LRILFIPARILDLLRARCVNCQHH